MSEASEGPGPQDPADSVDARSEIAGASETSADPVAEGRRRTRILVVDDDPTHRLLAMGLLRGRGYQVAFATDGRQALELVRRTEFDLVLMDLQMPTMDGLEAAEAIRAAESRTGGRRVPIVALTSLNSEEDRRRTREAGMDDHLPKPIDPERLDEAIARHVVTRGGEFHLADALRRAAGDRDRLDMIVSAFLSESPWRLGAIQRALDRHDGVTLADTAHRIEGAAQQLALPRLREIAHRVALTSERGDFETAAVLTRELEAALDGSTAALRRAFDRGA